jgi:hypothetical protein
VLERAKNNLGKSEIIAIKAGACCSYLQNSLESVLSHMNASGYDLIGIVDLNSSQTPKGERKAGILWLVDLVFAVQGGRILKAFRELMCLRNSVPMQFVVGVLKQTCCLMLGTNIGLRSDFPASLRAGSLGD